MNVAALFERELGPLTVVAGEGPSYALSLFDALAAFQDLQSLRVSASNRD